MLGRVSHNDCLPSGDTLAPAGWGYGDLTPRRTPGVSERGGQPGRPGGLERADVLGMPQRQADVVQPLQQPPAGVVVDLERRGDLTGPDLAVLQVDGDLRRRVALDGVLQCLDGL